MAGAKAYAAKFAISPIITADADTFYRNEFCHYEIGMVHQSGITNFNDEWLEPFADRP